MFDIGWTEFLLIGLLVLLVMGPKEIPAMMRRIGQITGRIRRMAGLFRMELEKIPQDTGIKDIADDIKSVAPQTPDLFGEPRDKA